MALKKTFFILINILIITSCSTTDIKLKTKRKPSSEIKNKQACADIMNNILSKRMSRQMPLEVKEYIIQNGGEYWTKYYKQLFKDPWFYLTKRRIKMLEWFMDLNGNDLPAHYMNNKNEPFIQIKKLEELLMKPITTEQSIMDKKLVRSVKKWFTDYEKYDLIMNNYLKDYMSLDYAVKKMINDKPLSDAGYGLKVEFEVLHKGKMKMYSRTYDDEIQYTAKINSLKRKRAKYKAGRFIKTGLINDRQFHQAELKRQMLFLDRTLRGIVEDNERNGIENNEEIFFFLNEFQRLMKIDHIKPPKKYESKLLNKEFIEEIKDIFNTFEDHEAIRAGSKWYKSLTRAEKKRFEIFKSHGKSGDFLVYLKKNKWYILATSLGGGSSAYGAVILIFNFFNDEFIDRRLACIEIPRSKEEKKYFDCTKRYFEDKYLDSNPLKLLGKSKDKALAAFGDDEELYNQFLLERDLMDQDRLKELEYLKLEDEFRKKRNEKFKDFSSDKRDPELTKQ